MEERRLQESDELVFEDFWGAPVEEPIQSERDANYKANTQTYTDIHRPKHLQLAKPAKYVAVNSRLCYIVD